MSEIQGVGPTQGPKEIERRSGRTGPAQDSSAAKGSGDTVHLSRAASEAVRFVAKLKEVPDVRMERVAQIKQAIQAGTYLTDDKIDKAVQSLLNDL